MIEVPYFSQRIKKMRRNSEKGAMLVAAALGMAGLMFMGAVGVDVGKYYVEGSNLQNAADAAAIAGASVYVQNGKLTLVPASDITENGNTITVKIGSKEYTFTKESDKTKGYTEAARYVTSNTGDKVTLSNDDTELWKMPVTVTQVTGKTASYADAYCYRVNVNDTVPMSFARFFGIESWPIDANAVAMVMPSFDTVPEDKDITEFIKTVNANIYHTVPNFYWETIHDGGDSFSIKGTDGKITTRKGYGDRSSKYFTTSYSSYIDSITKRGNLSKSLYAAYLNGSDRFCSYGMDTVKSRSNNLKQLEYTLDSDLIRKASSDGSEITGLFLDRPNVGSNSNIRATVLNITDDNISDNNEVPLFMRFESEPVIVGSSKTYVQPITVNVQEYQEKPLVIAYDGPDPNRTANDAPRINSSDGSYNSKGDTATATTQSAPYTLHLEADFNGVIYAPYSKVTITGTGKINGFIMAAEIDDQSTNAGSRKSLESQEVELPTWGATPRSGNQRFDYEVTTVTNKYKVVYDDFHNYTMSEVSM